MYKSRHTKFLFFLPDLTCTWIFSKYFRKKKYSNIKFHENPSSGSRAVPCRRTDGWTHRTKLIVAFHKKNFRTRPKNRIIKKKKKVASNLLCKDEVTKLLKLNLRLRPCGMWGRVVWQRVISPSKQPATFNRNNPEVYIWTQSSRVRQ
jgi:hypothetical protein